ncbi:2-oxo acid dehydrogenase subunit E2 [Nonomuraea sp. LP-02]|uniref:2-oxo acid dehydrogenase subunit E2 n=1 Tax=Nonomuraea sp. LP-02 TaxID=3097960 RepID=UPI002E303B0D|nr:2-oxo acid dehydrogenase subunit E2 [Nonomuraea sp. LP-02]MED7923535.1 2-oxo acid dehydrogenase subunit E2 [Nonomuraea sp. LP-02]
MNAVVVPKINSNDARYLLVEWVAADGATVRPGDVLALIETSKTVEELAAECGGVLRHRVAAGAECLPGETIADLGNPADPATPTSGGAPAGEDPPGDGVVITAPARRLMDELGIGEDAVRALGRKIIRRDDVTALAQPARARPAGAQPAPVEPAPVESAPVGSAPSDPDAEEIILPVSQRRVADVVARAHREVPAAYTVVKVDVEDALRLGRELTPALRTLIGLPELLVKAVAGLAGRFELLFATPVGPGRVRRSSTAHVGVTMDVGKGLFVPVVHDATGRTLREISRTLMAYRMAALRGGLREEELSGGNITLTLHNESTVTLAVPIVFPGQLCALSLAAPQQELVPAEGPAGFAVRHTVHLGLAYDHRYVNGHDAIVFLDALRAALEAPAGLAADPT